MSRSVPTFSSEIYDVALSFAGEDRIYVEAVALALKANNVKVFYDSFEKSNLWGKNLYDHLHDIYQKKSRFTVIFISTNYAKKAWTNHERQAAQARAFNENSEYILPARFDDTSIPGLDNTVGYISLTNLPPNEFVEIILNKLKSPSTNTTLDPAINHTIALPISPEKTRTKIPPTSTVIILLFLIITLTTLNYLAAIELYPPGSTGEKFAILFAGLLMNTPIVIGSWFLLKFIQTKFAKLRGQKQ